jgi:hypothetical protein
MTTTEMLRRIGSRSSRWTAGLAMLNLAGCATGPTGPSMTAMPAANEASISSGTTMPSAAKGPWAAAAASRLHRLPMRRSPLESWGARRSERLPVPHWAGLRAPVWGRVSA